MPSYPSTVEAITIQKTGGVEVLEKTTQPFPTISPGDVVIKVQYGGVNYIDTYFRKGLYPIEKFPAIQGQEVAGELIALPTDQTVLSNPEYTKRSFKVGEKVVANRLGAFAEYIAIPWTDAFPIPGHVPVNIAAAGFLQGVTAVSFMDESYHVKKGDIILVHTVAGGLGLLFCQYAKSLGATVIGTTSTQAKADLAKKHGADYVILYPVEDTVQRVLEITKGEGVHGIFDGVGKDTFDSNFKMIRRKGTLVSVGNASGAVPPFPPLKLVEKNVTLLRPTMKNYVVTPEESYHYTEKVLGLIADGTLKINIHHEYPFTAEGVAQAQTDLTAPGGKTTGKLLIKISD